MQHGRVGDYTNEFIGNRLFAPPRIVSVDPDVPVVPRCPAQLSAHGVAIHIACLDIRLRYSLHVAVLISGGKRQPAAQLILNQWKVDTGLGVNTVTAACGHGRIAVEFAIGWLCNDVYRATDRVFAEQGPLRAPQNLDAFHVDEVKNRTRYPRQVDIIHVDADARVGAEKKIRLANTANEKLGIIRTSGISGTLIECDIRRKTSDIGQVIEPGMLNLLGGKSGDGDGRFLQALLSFPRRYEYFFKLSPCDGVKAPYYYDDEETNTSAPGRVGLSAAGLLCIQQTTASTVLIEAGRTDNFHFFALRSYFMPLGRNDYCILMLTLYA